MRSSVLLPIARAYLSTGRYFSAQMCIVTLRVLASKQAAPHEGTPAASRIVATPLIHVNTSEPPERVALPVQRIQQPQARADDSSDTILEQRTTQPVLPTGTPHVPQSTPGAPQSSSEESASPSRRSSIRSAIHRPGSSGSRTLKRVRFALFPADDSLDPSVSASSDLDPPAPVPFSPTYFEMKAMASKDKPATETPRYTKDDKWEILSDVSSEIDDGGMVQQTGFRRTQEETKVSHQSHGWDLDSELGSAVDGTGPALPVPLKHKVHLKGSPEQPVKHEWAHMRSVPAGHAAHRTVSNKVEHAKRNFEDAFAPPHRRRVSSKAGAAPSAPSRLFAPTACWENDSEIDSTTDDNIPAVRTPLTSFVSVDRQPIRLSSERVSRTPREELNSTLWSAIDHSRPSNRYQATPRAPSRHPPEVAVDSSPTQPAPIFIYRSRDQRPPSVERERVVESSGSGDGKGSTESRSRARDSSPAFPPRAYRNAYYDHRTGATTYEGLREGYIYVTKPKGAQADFDGLNNGDSARRGAAAAREARPREPIVRPARDDDSDDSLNELIRSIPGGVERWGLRRGKNARSH